MSPLKLFFCVLQLCVSACAVWNSVNRLGWVHPVGGVPDLLADRWEDGWALSGLTESGTTGSH